MTSNSFVTVCLIQPHSKLLTDLERFNIVTRQSVSLPGSVDGLQNRDLSDELRKLKVSCCVWCTKSSLDHPNQPH